MSTQLYHAESRCKTSIVWLPQFSSIFMMDGDLFFESILKINRKSVHMAFFSQLRYYPNFRSASFDNFNRKLHSNQFSYMCVICVSKIVLFQFRNQYDNDVTVWSPQVSTFSRPRMLEVLWIQLRSLQSVFLRTFPAFKDILRDKSFDKTEDVIDSKGYHFIILLSYFGGPQ